MRILAGDTTTVLWEVNMKLPKEKQFTNLFQMREKTFRKGHKQVCMFCKVEGMTTINRIKFRNPIQSYLTTKNIWIKPDYYSTKVVSSPGYITLVHPCSTNKTDFLNELKAMLEQTKIDDKDKVVATWKSGKGLSQTDYGNIIPPFYLETSLRKWGDLQVEVLSLNCS